MNVAEKVQKVLALYADGGTQKEHLETVGLAPSVFYAYLRANSPADQILEEIERSRARMMVDESYAIALDSVKLSAEGDVIGKVDHRAARVSADIRLKIAAMYDRKRFGDRLAVDVQTVDITGALVEAKTRTLRPPCDLTNVEDAQVIEHTARAALPSAGVAPVLPLHDIFAD
jgi:hypothetical protein